LLHLRKHFNECIPGKAFVKLATNVLESYQDCYLLYPS
jgi:hypothetical protein